MLSLPLWLFTMKFLVHYPFLFFCLFASFEARAQVSSIICGKTVYASDRSTSDNSLTGDISDQYLNLSQMAFDPITKKNKILKTDYKRLDQTVHFPRVYSDGHAFAFVFLSERSVSDSESSFMIVGAVPSVGKYWKIENAYDYGLMSNVTECELVN